MTQPETNAKPNVHATRRAVVVGGSGGIGSDICRRLAADGFTVIVGYGSNAEAAAAVVDELGGSPHRATQIPVTDSATLQLVAETIDADFDGIDVLVNCGGMTRPVPHDDLDALDDELIDQIFAVNWRGPFATIRAFRSLLEKSEDPVIINISSVSGVSGIGSNVAYCASKAALDSLTRSLGRSLAPELRIVSVSPGWVEGAYAASMPAEIVDSQRAVTPLGRLASGADVAAAVVAVIDHLPLTTGAIIPVDGGRPLGT